jgi:2-keto-3-deoxy-L-rhamnonate aldolase RhmA
VHLGSTKFKKRWHDGEVQFGIFTRLNAPEAYETLALSGLDVIIIDVEHGSFDREGLSQCCFAARTSGLTVLVRVMDAGLPAIQHAIGIGANGIIVPHVADVEAITAVSHFVRTTGIERAYAGASRISQLRQVPWSDFRTQVLEQFMIVAQIDEPAGIIAAKEIVRLDEIDAIFIGRIGLSLAMDAAGQRDEVDMALGSVCRSCREHGKPIGVSLPDDTRAQHWFTQGVSLFVIDSDHTILLNGTRSRLHQFGCALNQ